MYVAMANDKSKVSSPDMHKMGLPIKEAYEWGRLVCIGQRSFGTKQFEIFASKPEKLQIHPAERFPIKTG